MKRPRVHSELTESWIGIRSLVRHLQSTSRRTNKACSHMSALEPHRAERQQRYTCAHCACAQAVASRHHDAHCMPPLYPRSAALPGRQQHTRCCVEMQPPSRFWALSCLRCRSSPLGRDLQVRWKLQQQWRCSTPLSEALSLHHCQHALPGQSSSSLSWHVFCAPSGALVTIYGNNVWNRA